MPAETNECDAQPHKYTRIYIFVHTLFLTKLHVRVNRHVIFTYIYIDTAFLSRSCVCVCVCVCGVALMRFPSFLSDPIPCTVCLTCALCSLPLLRRARVCMCMCMCVLRVVPGPRQRWRCCATHSQWCHISGRAGGCASRCCCRHCCCRR